MKKLMFAVLAIMLMAGGTGTGQTTKNKIFRKLMQQKLESSQELLKGLALANFDSMQTSSAKLLEISSTEDWFAYNTREYKLFSNEFRRAAEKIGKRSKEKNLDGVALAYVELTMTCVRCHQYVREVVDVDFRPNGFE
jgi:cytochrome c556